MNIFSISELSNAQWESYFTWFQRITRRYMPREWVGDWQSFRQRKMANLEIMQTQEYVWIDNQQPMIWLRMELNHGQAMFDWNVDPTLLPLPHTLLASVAQQLKEYLVEIGKPFISVETGNQAMQQLAELSSAQLINRRYFYEFHKNQVQKSVIEAQVRQFEHRFPSLTFRVYKNRPDDILDVYIQLYNVVAASIPRADTYAEPYQSWPADDLRKLNQTNLQTGNQVNTGMLRDSEGNIWGLTDLNIHTPHPKRLYQGMTGVAPEKRGQGLGSWLKLAMLLYVWEEFPAFEIIDTDCNALNRPVQRMNERIGFVKTGEGWEYKIHLDHLQ